MLPNLNCQKEFTVDNEIVKYIYEKLFITYMDENKSLDKITLHLFRFPVMDCYSMSNGYAKIDGTIAII